nr:mannosyltransferase family protein [Anaerolineae bacterium]
MTADATRNKQHTTPITQHLSRITHHASRLTSHVLLIWLAWAAILLGYQALLPARLTLQRPDRALFWTPNETAAKSQNDKPYLLDPFMNAQVSWDSEFYLAIATGGYDDPAVRAVPADGRQLSLSYAFLPFYPSMMKAVAAPLRLMGMRPIAAATLAGVLVSLLGTLAGMLALYDLTRGELEEDGGLRAAFYLVIFPTGFFLAQVYTEGLFVGLAFGSLALMKRRRLGWAGLLAVLATWTRLVGVGLAIPLALAWWREVRAKGLGLRSLPRWLL